jgi:transcriptional regulator with XRE-family HTH domain
VKPKSQIAQRLREARETAKLSQASAGDLAGWGKEAQSRISHYELGRRSITISDLTTLAKIYRVNPVFLAFGENPLPDDEEKLLQSYRYVSERTQRVIRRILEAELEETGASKKGHTRSS